MIYTITQLSNGFVKKFKANDKEYEVIEPHLTADDFERRIMISGIVKVKPDKIYHFKTGGAGDEGGIIEKVVYRDVQEKFIFENRERRGSPIIPLNTLINQDFMRFLRTYYNNISDKDVDDINKSIERDDATITFYLGDRRENTFVSLKMRDFWTPWIKFSALNGITTYDSPNRDNQWRPYEFKIYYNKGAKYIVISDNHVNANNTYGAIKRVEIRWKVIVDRYISYQGRDYYAR